MTELCQNKLVIVSVIVLTYLLNVNILKLVHKVKGNYMLLSWDKPKMMLVRKLKLKGCVKMYQKMS